MMKTIGEWIKSLTEHSRRANEAKRVAMLRIKADDALQVREFEGRLYICYRDLPIIEQAELKRPVEQMVGLARGIYIEYFKNRRI